MNLVNQETGVVIFTGVVEKEDDQFVSYSPELGTASCGDTVEEAFDNLGEAIEVHLAAMEEAGTLLQFLRERNIRVDLDDDRSEITARIPVGKIVRAFSRSIPVPA